MRHRKSGRKLGRESGPRKALYRGLTRDLLLREAIVTTEAKAKEVRGMAEGVITLAKRRSIHARRQVLSFITDKDIVAKTFDDLADRYEERPGGYTRITKLGPRLGDGAPMVRLELI